MAHQAVQNIFTLDFNRMVMINRHTVYNFPVIVYLLNQTHKPMI